MKYKIIMVDKVDEKVTIPIKDFEEMMEEQYNDGYHDGYSVGHKEGYSEGLHINAQRSWWDKTNWQKITVGDSTRNSYTTTLKDTDIKVTG